jgi:uncharacterized protein
MTFLFSFYLYPSGNTRKPTRRIDSALCFQYIQKMIALFRFFLYLIAAYLIYAFLRFLFSPRRPSRSNRPRSRLSGRMVKDEVCNTYLPEDEAILEKADGVDHYFCSQDCRQQFLEEQRSRR